MTSEFFQAGPVLKNQYQDDQALKGILRHWLPAEVLREVEADLDRLGARAVGELLAFAANANENEPVHVPFDPWGRRIDRLETSAGWNSLVAVAAEEGIVATGYERKYGAYSRLVQFAKLYLFHPSSAFVSCPLAMTDGAARAIELYGDAELKNGAFRHLTSRDPRTFWTSGQWMTEKTGGSDVSGTSTIARPVRGGGSALGDYELHGVKWFTSATSSQMAMALARIEGHTEGSRGLSLFYLETQDPVRGGLRNIEILRLKDKLGTRAMPTAELQLKGVPGKLVGGEGQGVKKIASLFNITRMYNSVCAVAASRRALALARDYSAKRQAFGRLIIDQPLHAETLAKLTVEFEGCLLLTFFLAELLGRDELGLASSEESAMLRLLTPIAKLYTARACMAITSECVETFAGVGYIEDSGLPTQLRDNQVFSIWEGTTNVLALDVLRAIEKEGSFEPLLGNLQKRLSDIRSPELAVEVEACRKACLGVATYLRSAAADGVDCLQAGAREFAYSLARIVAAVLLLERGEREKTQRSLEIARRWCQTGLDLSCKASERHRAMSRLLIID